MIKTRFAPSPTGYLHIGGLRTALYNYLFAKQNKGDFVLRIEDTDRSRYVKNAEKQLIKTMQKMGLEWDEGPIMINTTNITEKGQNDPYFQSKRVKIYQEYAQKLIDSKNAYYCTCSEARLKELRELQMAKKLPPKYDGCCRKKDLRPKTPRLRSGQAEDQFVIRLKVAEQGTVKFNDMIRGEVKIDHSEIDDQILLKSDGFPTYHLASVVDDHLMGITHVIRGEEWLPSTPKHILLYQAFGWDIPEFAHLPLLLNPDKSKLSKRQGDVSVEDFLDKNWLPEALINYVALLGWHPKDNREFFTLKDLVKEFDIKRVQKGGAIFDLRKLHWFNSYHLKQKTETELLELIKTQQPISYSQKKFQKILRISKERLTTIAELVEYSKFYFELPNYDAKILIFKKSDNKKTKLGIGKILEKLENVNVKDWKIERLKDCLEKIIKENNLTNGDVFWPVRVAVSGLEKSPPPEEIMEVLGKDESLNRIKKAIEKL